MSERKHLGTWVTGMIGGILGIHQAFSPEQEPKPRAEETISDETPVPIEDAPKTHDDKEQNEESSRFAHATKQLEELPTYLPKLRGMPEQPRNNDGNHPVEKQRIDPYAGIDQARAYVTDFMNRFGLQCVDRYTRPNLEDLPQNTIGLKSGRIGEDVDPERAYFVNVSSLSDEAWEAMFKLMFFPNEHAVEFTPDPEYAKILEPVKLIGDEDEIKKQIEWYIAQLQLARTYLRAGLTPEEVKQKLEEQAKKQKRENGPEQVASAQNK